MSEAPVLSFATRHEAAGLAPAACFFARRARAAVLAGALIAAATTPAWTAEFVLGVAGPMSGPLAEAGKQFRAAVELAAAGINKSGGLNGEAIVVVPADDGATAAGARKAARALVARNVRAVIGHYNSNPTIAASDIYAQANVLVVAPTAIIARLTDRAVWNVFRLAPRHDAQTLAASRWIAARFPKGSVALLHDTTPFSRSLARKAGSDLAAAGLAIPLREEIPADAKQARPMLSRLAARIAAGRIDAVYWTGGPSNAVALAVALRQHKTSAPIIGADALATDAMPRLARPEALAGMRAPVAVNPAARDSARPIVAALRARLPEIDAANGEPAIAAYAAVEAIAAAARVHASNDPRRIADALRSGKPFETIAGTVSFTFSGDRRETLYRIHKWIVAEDGKAMLVAE